MDNILLEIKKKLLIMIFFFIIIVIIIIFFFLQIIKGKDSPTNVNKQKLKKV